MSSCLITYWLVTILKDPPQREDIFLKISQLFFYLFRERHPARFWKQCLTTYYIFRGFIFQCINSSESRNIACFLKDQIAHRHAKESNAVKNGYVHIVLNREWDLNRVWDYSLHAMYTYAQPLYTCGTRESHRHKQKTNKKWNSFITNCFLNKECTHAV